MRAAPVSPRRGRDPVQDRLATAIFVAALVHGLVIMGVKFGAPILDDGPLPTLEILLVPNGPDEPQPNDDAAYLAQRTQKGSGTSEAARRSSLPEARPQPPDSPELPVDPELERPPTETARGQGSVLAQRRLDAERLPTGAEETT